MAPLRSKKAHSYIQEGAFLGQDSMNAPKYQLPT